MPNQAPLDHQHCRQALESSPRRRRSVPIDARHPTRAVGITMDRTKDSIRQAVSEHDISLNPVNWSRHN